MSDCIFCKIANKEIPAKIIYEDDEVLAFEDIHPLAPVHVLLIPKKHISGSDAVTKEDITLIGKINYLATQIAKERGIGEKGFRLVCNCGPDSGQEVFHLHYHLLGGVFLGPFVKQ